MKLTSDTKINHVLLFNNKFYENIFWSYPSSVVVCLKIEWNNKSSGFRTKIFFYYILIILIKKQTEIIEKIIKTNLYG